MPHLSELHGAATHLAVVAVPVYLLILLVRRAGRGGASLEAAEPWVVGGRRRSPATGVARLDVALARGTAQATAGRDRG